MDRVMVIYHTNRPAWSPRSVQRGFGRGVLRQGKIVEMGTVEEVFENPRHEYTKHLLVSNLEV